MAYIDGTIIPIPAGNKAAYVEKASAMAKLFVEFGAIRVMENWANDISRGKINDFYTATLAEKGETIAFSWIEWPDKATRDAAWGKLMADPRMANNNMNQIMSGQRMIWGGFENIVE
ncbi:MAG: hypothetical protein FD128_1191, partial [Hyphomonadaceae bacterium]